MNGIEFYFYLRFILNQGDTLCIDGRYEFIRWLENGNLQVRINEDNSKSIPAEIIIAAAYARNRTVGNNPPIVINDNWIINNGQDNWCFDNVINYLLDTYNSN